MAPALPDPRGPSRRQLVRDWSSSPFLQTPGLPLGPASTPHSHPLPWTSRATPDSPSAEWQTCCWGCAGAQLHASPSPGGRSSASNRSSSAQLGAVRVLRGMSRQRPDSASGDCRTKQLLQGFSRTRRAPRPWFYEVDLGPVPPRWAPPSFGCRPPAAAGPAALLAGGLSGRLSKMKREARRVS